MRMAKATVLLSILVFAIGCPVAPSGGGGDGNTDPCDGVTCDAGETCMDGQCVSDGSGNGGGDAVAGQTIYDMDCMGCHAADASGGTGPNIQGASADDIRSFAVEGNNHPLMYDLTDAQVADIEAYLASLVP